MQYRDHGHETVRHLGHVRDMLDDGNSLIDIPSLPKVIAPKTTLTALFCVEVIFLEVFDMFCLNYDNEELKYLGNRRK